MVIEKRGARALAYYVGSLVVAVPLAMALKRYGEEMGPAGVAVASAATFAAAHGAFLWYWRGLDETAREAHKYAVFWGGMLAACPVAVAIVTLQAFPEVLPVTEEPGTVFALGMAAPLVLWLLAGLIAWTYWWLRRR